MDFKNYLQESAGLTEKAITKYLQSWKKSINKDFPKLLTLIDLFADSCKGGKRLRGSLVRLGYEMVNGADNREILTSAAAVEIFQTSILAHDDIIDLSETRRGKPTLYRSLGGDHYGISQTICLGDIGFFLALKCITDSNFTEERKNKAASEFSKMFINTGLGEMLDVELPRFKTRDEKDVLVIYKYKTAYYTIIYPLSIGAILGGAGQKLLDQIEEFGLNLGIAFQIQDDILGVFGDEKTLGKSVTSDVEEGKNTLLITQALKKANPKQKKVLDKLYGKGKLTTDQFEQIKQVFIVTEALDYSQKKAAKLVKKAKDVLKQMEISAQYKSLLSEMADFIVSRNK